MFLYNKYRNARQENLCGDEVIAINWKTFLNTNPVYGAESTATFDNEENAYFGSHSGNFYSLDRWGKIRWTFTTKKKIYSSPIIIDSTIYFMGGDGCLYCLDLDGNLLWFYNLAVFQNDSKFRRLLRLIVHLPFTFDIQRKKNIVYRSWCSPNYVDGKVLVTGYGIGLYCFDTSGRNLWEFDLKFPRFQLSGTAIDDQNNIYCISRRGIAYCLSLDGLLLWKKKLKKYWEPWGNPVVCHINKLLFVFLAKREKQGYVFALSLQGKVKWKLKIGAIRGSCAITSCGSFLYCCDLDGIIYKIKAVTGEIIIKRTITTCSRGLWITPTLDKKDSILLSTKDGSNKGRVIKFDSELNIIWEFKTNKVLSVPVINSNGDVFFGSWDGYYYSLKTL